ncbi:lipid II flippase MurJ [Marihabitans asiaticum]|uniref:Putative peptidoglycan lipid II flippase n=1 Tax=Marihabitans asiaticum TaxID=415218 RepID=A0A560WAK8_9MICO|nr:lipid II flippase MurJ [Marihabitans asiaticum]TWD14664.1 putative peptidoglycan lipid II flippase [Marihabitans asiaticum]
MSAGPRESVALRTAAAQVGVVTGAARVAGLLRWLAFAGAVGASGVGTVYQSVNAVPNLVYEIAAGGVLAAVVVPLVAQASGRARSDHVASALLTRAVAVLLPASIALALAAPWISRALLAGVEVDGAAALGTRLLVLFSPQVLLYGIGIVVTGVLQAHERLLAAALAPLLSSVVVIATYLLYAAVVPRPPDGSAVIPTAGWVILGVGTTAGVAALSLPLLAVAASAGITLRPRWSLSAEETGRAASLAAAGVVALIAQQLALLVVIRVANRSGGDGALVVHQYAQTVYLLPYAVLAVPIATATFARLARSAGEEGAARTLGSALRVVTAVSGAAAAGLVAAAPAVGVAFGLLDRSARQAGAGSGALDALPVALASTALGLVGFSVTALATRSLYLHGRAVQAGLAMAVGWVISAGVPAVVLAPDAGPGRTLVVLGCSSAAGMSVAATILLVLVRRDWGPTAVTGLARLVGVVGGALVLACVLAWLVRRSDLTEVPALAVSLGVATVLAALTAAAAAVVDPVVRAALLRWRS